MYVGYMQILGHFIQRTWAFMDIAIHKGPGNNHPGMPGGDLYKSSDPDSEILIFLWAV